ncbi:hypothetical protein GCM10022281_14810 [Sphingomonas rosea]|uniref:Uncharacterized protein n=1 Tax=Sphingomonas rosea TaxID=335605 RepID=A0ABP7U429_9SPHN
MSDDRLSDDYAAALGRAIHGFARLEWMAVRCCERLRPGALDELSDRTAGRIADTLIHLLGRPDAPAVSEPVRKAARDFEFLVGTRNNLVHARPGLAPDGTEALFRDGDQWTLDEFTRVTATFAACEQVLADALAGPLA